MQQRLLASTDSVHGQAERVGVRGWNCSLVEGEEAGASGGCGMGPFTGLPGQPLPLGALAQPKWNQQLSPS